MDKLTEMLYEKAFAFKQAKLWKKLGEDCLFAVKHSDGTIGYCRFDNIFGTGGNLLVYPGAEGLASLRDAVSTQRDNSEAMASLQATIKESFVGCQLMPKHSLLEGEVKQVRQYCVAHKQKPPQGRGGWPQLMQSKPGYAPWTLEGEEGKRHLLEALDVCQWLSDMLKKETKNSLGFRPGLEPDTIIPLIEWEPEGNYRLGTHRLPDAPLLPEVTGYNEVLAEKLKRTKKTSGTWRCDVFYLPIPTDEDDGDEPRRYFPSVSLAMGGKEPHLDMCHVVEGSDRILLDNAIKFFLEEGRPKKIITVTERAYRMYAPLGRQAGIQTVLYEDPHTEHYAALMEEELAICADMLSLDEMLDDDLDEIDGEMEDDVVQKVLDFINTTEDYEELPDDVIDSMVAVALEYEDEIKPARLRLLRREQEKRGSL